MIFDATKYDKNIPFMCSTCGHTSFETDNEELNLKCIRCGRITSREELKRDNEQNIQAHLEETEKDLIKHIEKEFGNILKKTFNGKNYTIK